MSNIVPDYVEMVVVRERLIGGTPKRTKAAWPEKATSENATCDENMFLFFRENMNRIVPENVVMVCERAT